MKVVEKFVVPLEQLPDFLFAHTGQTLTIKDITEKEAIIHTTSDYTEAEFHMGVLLTFRNSDFSTLEEKNAVDYAINAIKTLVDMGVIFEHEE